MTRKNLLAGYAIGSYRARALGALLAFGIAMLALAWSVPAHAGTGKISKQELKRYQDRKSDLVSATLDTFTFADKSEEACVTVKAQSDPRVRPPFKRAMKQAAADAKDEATAWDPLEVWGEGLHDRARAYSQHEDVVRVRQASQDISIGATFGHSALKHVSKELIEYSKLQCADPDGQQQKAQNAFGQAEKSLGDGFDKLNRVVGG